MDAGYESSADADTAVLPAFYSKAEDHSVSVEWSPVLLLPLHLEQLIALLETAGAPAGLAKAAGTRGTKMLRESPALDPFPRQPRRCVL